MLYEEEQFPYLDRDCVIYPRLQAVHVQPPQLIEKIGEFLVYSWSVTETERLINPQKYSKH